MEENRYEKICEQWQLKTVGVNFEERYKALGLEGFNRGNLPIRYCEIDYLIDPENADITRHDLSEKAVDSTVKTIIYHLFHYSTQNPRNSGNFVPLHELKAAAPFYQAFRKMTLESFAKTFHGRLDQLISLVERLGFKRFPNSDAGFQVMAFDCIPVRILFWEGDEELPAEASILFDSRVTEFTHVETVIVIGEDIVNYLIAESGLKRIN